ncbi:hypothetical protein [Massilia haematophila]|uniref:Uncharacterized protein n=1 Tax=Massilia haematophila TaxID=457923 RepID=A0ABV7PQX0_9BURK
MRRPIIVVFLSLFLMAVQALAAERGALFKVTSKGNTLYLYGTIPPASPSSIRSNRASGRRWRPHPRWRSKSMRRATRRP